MAEQERDALRRERNEARDERDSFARALNELVGRLDSVGQGPRAWPEMTAAKLLLAAQRRNRD